MHLSIKPFLAGPACKLVQSVLHAGKVADMSKCMPAVQPSSVIRWLSSASLGHGVLAMVSERMLYVGVEPTHC